MVKEKPMSEALKPLTYTRYAASELVKSAPIDSIRTLIHLQNCVSLKRYDVNVEGVTY